MISPAAAGAGLALFSAIAWGGGDFAGGMAVKAVGGSSQGAVRVVVTAHALSLPVLLAVVEAQHGAWPAGASLFWGLGAGVAGGLSLIAFYVALAGSAMGASAAISGLLAAAIPAVISSFVDGFPGFGRMVGFGIAAVAIWMIAGGAGTGESPRSDKRTLFLAVAAGIGFGLYFVALRFANRMGVVEPMALARVGSVATSLLLLPLLREPPGARCQRTPVWIGGPAWRWAVCVAVLDTGANLLFVAASRAGRLDVAAVLASLYPASTILLAAFLLGERPGRQQVIGMGVAVAAVVLITV